MTQDGINRFCGPYDFLSNYYSMHVEYDGLICYSAEAAFLAQKCAERKEWARFVVLYPDEAKHLGRKVECREDWGERQAW